MTGPQPRWDDESRLWFEAQDAEHARRVASLDQDVTSVRARMRSAVRAAGRDPRKVSMAAVLTAEALNLAIEDRAVMAHAVAAYAVAEAEQAAALGQLRSELARLDRHRSSIRLMRDALAGLWPWQWRRRRFLENELAHLAITLAEDQR